MSSSGLKLRDTRELLAKPDHTQASRSVHSPLSNTLESPTISKCTEQFSRDEIVISMSPSLVMANASSAQSNQQDSLSTEISSSPNASHENEPVSKKRRILDATEAHQEGKEAEKQKSNPEDILARACSAVGIGGDLAESMVEEPVSNHHEHNGETQRLPVYPRGMRGPHPSIPISPRPRHPNDMRYHHQVHPAFRQPQDYYGVEARPPYGTTYGLPCRAPLPHGEPHRYYPVPHYPNRYPYMGPPGSIPPSMSRPPVLRAVPPSAHLDRQHSVPHVSPGYEYSPRHIPSHHDPRIEPQGLRHALPAGSEICSVEQRPRDISCKLPASHSRKAVTSVPPEQSSPTARGHPYPRQAPHVNVQPKLHSTLHSPLDDPRSPHTGVNEAYVGGVLQHNIHPPPNSPQLKNSQELTCENPFQIPEPLSNTNKVLNSKPPPLTSHQKSLSVEVVNLPLDRNQIPLSALPHVENIIDKRDNNMFDNCAVLSRAPPLNSLQSKRIREPPEPCVELIPITVPLHEERNLSKPYSKLLNFQESPVISAMNDRNSKEETYSGPSKKAENFNISETVHHDSRDPITKSPMNHSVDKVPTAVSEVNEDVAIKDDTVNKGPKRSFRKRWLDIQNTPLLEKPLPHDESNFSEEKAKCSEKKGFPKKDNEKEMPVITLDDDEVESIDTQKIQNMPEDKIKSSLDPGQLNFLHSSLHVNQMRSASEPPFGTAVIPKNESGQSKRPASVPGAAQQPQNIRVRDESQIKTNTQVVVTPEARKQDDEFIDRLKLVLTDLISVPEATELQHPNSSIDDLLASLVKQRGAVPSKDPNPRQRLRQDFLVLVKLCMPKDVLEDWGWNNSQPEEILDQLIRVTNNGIDGAKGSAVFSSKKENVSVLPVSPPSHAQDKMLDVALSSQPSSSPTPIVSLSPVGPESSSNPSIPVLPVLPNLPPQSAPCPPPPLHHPANPPPVSPSHPTPILVKYPTLSPPQHPVAHPSKKPSPSHNQPPTAYHSLSNPSPQHPTSSPTSVFHSSPLPQQDNRVPSSRHSLPPLTRQTTIPSHLSEPPPLPPEESLEDDVFSPTNRDAPPPPPHLISAQNSHTASRVHSQPQGLSQNKQENGMPTVPTTQVSTIYPHNTPAFVRDASAYAHGSPAYPRGPPPYTQGSALYTPGATAYAHNTKTYTHITTAYTHTAPAYTHSPAAYTPSTAVYANSPNAVHRPPPVAVLHYSQLPQSPHNPSYAQHPSPHYPSPGGAQNLRTPHSYPRGPFSPQYPYPYYPSSDPHRPHRPPYHPASVPHRPPHPPGVLPHRHPTAHPHPHPGHPSNALPHPSPRAHPPPPSPPNSAATSLPRQLYSPQGRQPSNPNTHNAVHLIAQPPERLSPSNWNGSPEERIVTSAAIKPPA